MQKEDGRLNVGVLALQGAFIEHVNMIDSLGVKSVEVRSKDDLNDLDALIIPGGESTTMNLLMGEIKNSMKNLPIFGTCAGAILLAQHGFIDIEIERNAYGSQLDSFEDYFEFQGKEVYGIFIRAPKIKTTGKDVEVLSLNSKKEPVLVSQNNYLVSTFHPELTSNTKIHEYFLHLVKNSTRNL